MTIKYGSLNRRRPCSTDYRKQREDIRLAPREISGLSVAANEALRRMFSSKRHYALRYTEKGFVIRGEDAVFNLETALELFGNGYTKPFNVYYEEKVRIDLRIRRSRFAGYRLTDKGRVASDYLNGRRRSYGD